MCSSPEHRFCRERISRWRPWSKVRCSCRRNTTLLSTLSICRDRLLSSAMTESGGTEGGMKDGNYCFFCLLNQHPSLPVFRRLPFPTSYYIILHCKALTPAAKCHFPLLGTLLMSASDRGKCKFCIEVMW